MSENVPSQSPLIIPLPKRAVLSVGGEDCRNFLQGLVTQDVSKVSGGRALWSAFLTPQGKYLCDFFILQGQDGALWLEGEKDQLFDLQKRLKPYKLRARVAFKMEQDLCIFALINAAEVLADYGLADKKGAVVPLPELGSALLFLDPRLTSIGGRLIVPSEKAGGIQSRFKAKRGTPLDYDLQRIILGLPDGARDMETEKALLLENGFDELYGIDWRKGCFIGQELTARTKYRALLKKRLVPFYSESCDQISQGQSITNGAGKKVGDIKSTVQNWGLALLRTEVLFGQEELFIEEGAISLALPGWIALKT